MRRRIGSCLLAAMLLLGAVDLSRLHPDGDGFHLGETGHGDVYYPEARHPGQPIHVERAAPVERPSCPLCLHHQRTAGSHLPQVAAVEPPTGEIAAASLLACATAGGAPTLSRARAPPFFS